MSILDLLPSLQKLTKSPPKDTDHSSLQGSRQVQIKTAQSRLILLCLFFCMCYALVLGRLFHISVIQGNPLGGQERELAEEEQDATSQDVILRADILDRNGILLARSLKTASLYADPTLILKPEETAAALHRIFPDVPYGSFLKDLQRRSRFVWLNRHIMPEDQYRVLALGEPGLGFSYEYSRIYPQGALTSHVVGFSNVDGKGLSGIERSFNDILAEGQTPITLTIDVRLQHILRREMQSAIDSFMAKGGAGAIFDIRSGEILAAVSLPDFDPHHPAKSSGEVLFNRLTQGVYELGSTFKIFSTAAFLEQDDTSLTDTFDARKPLKRYGHTISDYHPEERILTVPETFMYSSNIGSALMAEAIGTEKLKDFFQSIRLFDPVNPEIIETGQPLIPSPWRDINTLTASYGHGIAITPLQLITAVAAIIGDGTLPQPTLIKSLRLQDKKSSTPAPAYMKDQVVKPATTNAMRKLLRLVVTDGTGEKADVPGYMIGGKTGTAEKIGTNGYDRHKLISSFIGVFPANNPDYAVFIMIDEPKGTQQSFGYATGGWVAAPAVGRVIKSMTALLGIMPYEEIPASLGHENSPHSSTPQFHKASDKEGSRASF